jgi:hypothetical protein
MFSGARWPHEDPKWPNREEWTGVRWSTSQLQGPRQGGRWDSVWGGRMSSMMVCSTAGYIPQPPGNPANVRAEFVQ